MDVAAIHMLIAGPASFVRGAVHAPAGQQGSWTGAPVLIGLAAGIAIVLVAYAAFRILRDRRTRAQTMHLIRRLIEDAEAATHDAVLVHQARRRVLPTRKDHR
jgi:hypothetical protein